MQLLKIAKYFKFLETESSISVYDLLKTVGVLSGKACTGVAERNGSKAIHEVLKIINAVNCSTCHFK